MLFIINPFQHSWVYVVEVTFGKHLMGWGLVAKGTNREQRVGTFSPTPKFLVEEKLEVESTM